MNFFFDNCISPRIAEAIQILEGDQAHVVIALRRKFPQGAGDAQWIRQLAQENRNWVVVSGDTRISRNRHEREAWLESRLTFFFWAPGWLQIDLWQQAWKMIKWWPAITDQAARIAPGAGFMIPVKGSRLQQVH